MAQQAISEIENCKENDLAYGGTILLASLIERQVIDIVTQKYKKSLLKRLEIETDSAQIILSTEDKKLFDFLLDNYVNDKQPSVEEMVFDTVSATTSLCFKLFEDNGIISSSDSEYKLLEYLIGHKTFIAFNKLLNDRNFTAYLDPRIVECLINVYLKDNMNLRNNLAHCSYSNFNYYNLHISYLLKGIFLLLVME